MNTVPGAFGEDRLVGLLAVVVLATGAVVYVVDALALWIAWWLTSAAIVGAVLVLLNRPDR